MLRLPVVSPCDVPWEEMTPTREGRHCAACQREVRDFSRMTEARARAHLLLFGGERLCGRVAHRPDGTAIFLEEPAESAQITAAGEAEIAPARRTEVAAARRGRAAAVAAMIATAGGCAEVPPQVPAAPARPVAELQVAVPQEAAVIVEEKAPPPPPVDTDQDGIPDDVDACPGEPGTASADPSKNGCRAFVGIVVTGDIRVLETVRFAWGASRVLPESTALLEEVAKVLQEHPEIAKVRVAGHASGDEKNGKRLSEQRAKAVVAALTKSGIDAARLEAVGRGADRPLAAETTADGRARNRRVEFEIVDSSQCAPAAAPASGASTSL